MLFRPLLKRSAAAALAVLVAALGLSIALAPSAYAAPTVGLVFQIVADGTAPWATPDPPAPGGAGNDSSATNGITRTFDTVALRWGINVNGQSADTAVLTQTLPIGMEWDRGSAPIACSPAIYSPDNRTITCDLGNLNAGTAIDMTAVAIVKGDNANGTFLTMPSPVFTAANGTGSATAALQPSLSTTVSATPKLNVRKDTAPSQYARKGADGTTPGLLVYYPISLEITGGGKGGEGFLPGDIVLRDTFTQYLPATGLGPSTNGTSLVPQNGVLYTWGNPATDPACAYNGHINANSYHRYTDMPYGSPNWYNVPDPNFERTFVNAGTWSCSQSGSGVVDITIAGADVTGSKRPRLAGYPYADYPLAADRTFLSAGWVAIWYPVGDFPTTGPNAYELDVRNRIEFVTLPPTLSGQPNVEPHNTNPYPGQNAGPNPGDPWYTTNDNNHVHRIYGRSGGFEKLYTSGESTFTGGPFHYYPPGSAGWRTGDAFFAPGQDFSSFVYRYNTGFLDLDTTLCDTFNNTWQELRPLLVAQPGNPTGTQAAFLSSNYWGRPSDYAPAVWPRPFTLEYSAKPVADLDELRAAQCDDDDGPWYPNLDVIPGGSSSVTRVRIKTTIAGGEYAYFRVSLVVKPAAPTMALLTNFGSFKDQYSNTAVNDGWLLPDYTPANDGTGNGLIGKPWNDLNYISPGDLQLPSGGAGDRARVIRSMVRVRKQTVADPAPLDSVNSVRAGRTITYQLSPTFTSYLPVPPTATNYYVYDVMDEWVTYVAGSSVSTPAGVAQPNVTLSTDPGSGRPITILRWDLGPRNPNQVLPTIRYTVRTKSNAPGGTATFNGAIVNAIDALGAPVDDAACLPSGTFSVDGITDLDWALPSATHTAQTADTRCVRGWARNVTITQVSSLTVGKEVVENAIQPDGTFKYRITYANVQPSPVLSDVNIIETLPEPGDGRVPANSALGTGLLVPGSIVLTDSVGGGTKTFYYTNASKATVRSIYETDPTTPLPITTVQWCLEADFGNPGCPGSFADVTAFRVHDAGPLNRGEFGVVEFSVVTKDNTDGNVYTNRAVGKAAEVSLPVSSEDVRISVVAGSISNFVWIDADGDGRQDAGEAPLPGTSVALFDSATNLPVQVWASAGLDGLRGTGDDTYVPYVVTTNGLGQYSFDDLAAGNYYVEFTPPITFKGTAPQNGDTIGDSTATRVGVANTYRTGNIHLGCRDFSNVDTFPVCDPLTLVNVDDDPTIDVGFVQPASIGDQVWRDVNGNGVQDAGDAGVPGALVTLWRDADDDPATVGWVQVTTNMDGTTFGSAGTLTTDATGNYLFEDLLPGIYSVRFEAPGDYLLTSTNSGTDDALDSDAVRDAGDPAAGRTAGYLVQSGENPRHIDAGIYEPASLGNFVWNDVDGDGVQDGAETGIAGAQVRLFRDADGNPATVDWTPVTADQFGHMFGTAGVITTGATGAYLFDELAPGLYQVDFTAPAGSVFTQPNAAADAADSDALLTSSTTARTATVDLVSNENDLTVDAGVTQPTWLGDRVWLDANGNGIQDAGESGIRDVSVTVERFDPVGALWSSTFQGASTATYPSSQLTDVLGNYSFADLAPGTYRIVVTPPTGYRITATDQGDDTQDSDINGAGVSGGVYLDPAAGNITVDAGLFVPASVGDFVWVDTDGDGRQDGGEPGVAGAQVTLWRDADGNPASADWAPVTADLDGNVFGSAGVLTTPASGAYLFANLRPGLYEARFTSPAGTVLTDANASSATEGTDSDPSTTNAALTQGATPSFTLDSGQARTDVDAGVVALASIGDRVWVDDDGDGQQDGGESGVAGAQVTLWRDADGNTATADWVQVSADVYGNVLGIAGVITTGASGAYVFDNLDPGVYEVRFQTPGGHVLTETNVGADLSDSDATALDVVRSAGVSGPVTLSSGDANTTVDAGVYLPASVGNTVWLDTDGDGVLDAGETGIAGAQVTLWRDADGDGATADWVQVIADIYGTTFGSAGILTTGATGTYLFDNLRPGLYQARFAAPAGTVLTDANVGAATESTDSDPIITNAALTQGTSPNFTLASGQARTDVDAGVTVPARLSNLASEDANGNGQQDGGESGVLGAQVTLWRDTDGDPGTVGWTQVTADIYGTAFGAAGTITTTASGTYAFDNLDPGIYEVRFAAPSGYVLTAANTGAADATDSDAIATNAALNAGATGPLTVISGTDNQTIDAGMYRPASVGDLVWDDLDGDGVQDAGEPGVAGADVTLWKDSDGDAGTSDWVQVTADIFGTTFGTAGTVVSDATGSYAFANLEPGLYEARFTAPAGMVLTDANTAVGTEATDSDPTITNAPLTEGTTPSFTLVSGQARTDVDSGAVTPASVGDWVFEDINGNGLQDLGEGGVAGAQVTLWRDADADPATADWVAVTTDIFGNSFGVGGTITTGPGGDYVFENLDPGVYQVRFVTPPGYVLTGDDAGADLGDSDPVATNAARTAGATAPVTLQSGDENTFVDAGVFRKAAIGNLVFEDTNRNGVQDAGEFGVANVPVRLTGTDGLGRPVIIDADTTATGLYSFVDLWPGTYSVSVAPTLAFVATIVDGATGPLADSVDSDIATTDSDPSPAQRFAMPATVLVSGETDDTWDAGLIKMPSISGNVYEDLDNDGVRDSADPGIEGVAIRLTGNDFNGNPVDVTVTTDVFGFYIIPNLLPSDAAGYTITQTQPVGYLDGRDTAGSAGGSAAVNDAISGIVLLSSQASVGNDFGELLAATVSGFVYVDSTDDGIFQAGEVPIEGTIVTLTGVNDLGHTVSRSTTTAADGSYSFTGLRPGTYTVTETQPTGYPDGRDTAGSTGGSTTTNDRISSIVVDSGEASTGNNFGELPASAAPLTRIEGSVWLDENRDGTRQAGESTGVAGVTITLKLPDGTVVASAVTDASGRYAFVGIEVGDYVVEQTQPAEYLSTSPDTIGTPATPLSVPAGGLFNQDFLEALGSLAGSVYEDVVDNGDRDPTEPGIGGVVVRLYDATTGALLSSTVTSADGSYVFENLVPGTYRVVEVQPGAFLDDVDDAGSHGGSATDDIITGIVLAAGDQATGYNFGESRPPLPPGTTYLSGHVYVDSNDDGDLDSGEAGLAGVTIELWQGGVKIAETVTDAGGAYRFDGIAPGVYTVKEIQPDSYTSTEEPDNEITDVTVPPSGLGDQDFGESLGAATATTALSGFAWLDRDGDGIVDIGEHGIVGVVITLKNAAGTVIGTTVTDASGAYSFGTLAPGTYTIEQTQPAGYASSPGTPATVIASVVVPIEGIANQNFGEQLATVSGYVYDDTSNDGILDPTETGIGGVTLTLTGTDISGSPVNLTVATDASGYYQFVDLLPPDAGGYTITETQPAGYADGIDTVGSSGGAVGADTISAVVFAAGTDAGGYNFGEQLVPPVTPPGTVWVSGVVYYDADRDGTIDAGDTPMVGVKMYVLDALGVIVGTTVTAADGSYVFTGLTPGATYTITQDQPAGYGSSEVPSNSSPFVAPATGGLTGLDFGETLSSLSGVVWDDDDNDGVRDAGEAGIAGVTVTLNGTAADGTQVSQTTVTGPDGSYLFDELKSGNYTLVETQPLGYVDGLDLHHGVGPAPLTSNDRHASIELPVATDADGYDFGEMAPPPVTTSISGRVFLDRGADGMLPNGTSESSEPGIGGVTLVLRNAAGAVVATTVTLPDGTYLFEGIAPGSYLIEQVQSAGYGSSTANIVAVTVPVAGATNVNFGETLGATYGIVFSDIDGDGERDATEPGVGGVTITLTGLDSNGNPVTRTVVTDADGSWSITDLPPSGPAGYTVVETQPDGWLDGKDTSSKNGTIANDRVSGVQIGAGEIKESGNFGEYAPARISGVLTEDANGSGVRDAGERPLAGATVTLTGTDANGAAVTVTVTTAADGSYSFDSLAPGSYTVAIAPPPGMKATYVNVGSDDSRDSDFDPSCGCTRIDLRGNPTPASTENDVTTVDGGLYVPVSVEGVVFGDSNRDGARGGSEPAVAGRTVTVQGSGPDGVFGTADDPAPITVTTNESGKYTVPGLPPGTYRVTVSGGEPVDVTVLVGAGIVDLPVVAAAGGGRGPLAFTGANVARLVLAGLLMIGVGLILAGPRRRRHAS